MIQAWMVDAETAEIQTSLSDGQRRIDLDITMENVLGGLLDVATELGEPDAVFDQLVVESQGVVDQVSRALVVAARAADHRSSGPRPDVGARTSS